MELERLAALLVLLWAAPPPAGPVPSTEPPQEPPPDPPPDPPPCDFNSMCSCSATEVSCVAVPLYRMPAVLHRRSLHHVEVLHAALGALEDGALAGIRTSSLRLIGDHLVHVAPHALAPLAGDLRSLDLSYNELHEVPAALRPLRNLHWLSLHGNQLTTLDVDWGHLKHSLTHLYVGENELTELPDRAVHAARHAEDAEAQGRGGQGALSELQDLHTLEVDNNQLSLLPASALPASLRSLSARGNALVRVPSALLEAGALPRLQQLLLRGNRIRTLPRAGLRAPRALARLDLADNEIQSLPSQCFNGTLSVRELVLEQNALRALPPRAFQGMQTERLSLAGNHLASVHPAALAGLEQTLGSLDLDGNALRAFPGAALANLTRLRTLSVANNRLGEVHDDALPASLRALSLAGNALRALPVRALRRCAALVQLNAGYNGIARLEPDHLQGWASSLESLLLPNNNIANLAAGAFRHAPRLRELNLSFNRLGGVHADAFQGLAGLQSLEASFALAEAAADRFPAEALRPLAGLRWLALDNNDIRALPGDALRPLTNLQFVNLEDNLLDELPPGMFSAEHGRLRELRLGYNSLRAVRAGAFRGLPALRTLVLAGNHIQVLESSALEDLPRLETLLLADNRLGKLQPRALRGLPSLSSLDLHRNRLQVFSLSAFVNVSRSDAPLSLNASWNRVSELYSGDTEGTPLFVHTLDLSHNFVAELRGKFLAGVGAALRRLYLGHNRVSRLDGHVLGALPALELLSLEDNDLVALDAAAFRGCGALQVLLLARNHVSALQAGQFAGLGALRVLDLAGNKLRAVAGGALAGTALERLDLSHNALAAVPVAALAEVGASLRWLGLAGNAVQHLDGTVFLATPGLRHLDLADNRLSFLADNVFSPLGALLSLRLGHNPLRANLAELLHHVPALRDLALDDVGLRAAPLLPLPSLVALNLSANALPSVPWSQAHGGHGGLPALRALHLADNRLTAPPEGPFPLLSTLDLSHNPIQALSRESFAGLPRLRSLALRSLPLRALDADALQPLALLRVLRADAWTDIGPHGLGRALAAAPALRVLSLSVAAAARPSQGPGQGPPLPAHVLAGALRPGLRRLELSGPGLRALGPHSLGGELPDLRRFTLQVSGTPLAEFPAALFARLANIPHLSLDFRENCLSSLAPETFYRNSSSWERSGTALISGGINLMGNPWECDCSLSWLGAWLRRWLREVLQVHALEVGAAARVREAAQGAACALRHPPAAGAAPGPPLLRLRATGCHASALSAAAPRLSAAPGALAALVGLVLGLLRALPHAAPWARASAPVR